MNKKQIEEIINEFDKLTPEDTDVSNDYFESEEWLNENEHLFTGHLYDEPAFTLDKDKIIEWLKEKLTQVHDSAIEGCVKIVKMNSKGSFTDDAGNDCWYIDELIETLSKQKLKLKL